MTRGIVDVRDAGDAPQWWPYEGGDGRRSCTARNNPISGISFGFPFSERENSHIQNDNSILITRAQIMMVRTLKLVVATHLLLRSVCQNGVT